jgi:Peptidase family M28
VLEMARVLGSSDVQVDVSIRMIFWNNEETGLNGSYRYVQDRAALQGVESPAGSGKYPEPTWVGMITHDQILFDHGTPASANQNPNADADIEYQGNSVFAPTSQWLANSMVGATYAKDYPAEVSNNMCCTDSVPFQNYAPAVSVRENRRVAEMEYGAAPHWHKTTDVFATYTSQDFLFGFNIAQRTLGSVAQWCRLRIVAAAT